MILGKAHRKSEYFVRPRLDMSEPVCRNRSPKPGFSELCRVLELDGTASGSKFWRHGDVGEDPGWLSLTAGKKQTAKAQILT